MVGTVVEVVVKDVVRISVVVGSSVVVVIVVVVVVVVVVVSRIYIFTNINRKEKKIK